MAVYYIYLAYCCECYYIRNSVEKLTICWNSVYRRVFAMNTLESVMYNTTVVDWTLCI